MGGNTIKYDAYDLRKYGPRDIDLFIDIGANIGVVSMMARFLFPFARIYAFEPCERNYEILVSNIRYWGIECHNMALGPGTPMCKIPHSQNGSHRFVDDDEKNWWPEKICQMAASLTIKDIIKICGIDQRPNQRYILKIDCEGGERYILRQKESANLIRDSVQTNIEIHMPFGGRSKEWDLFFGMYSDTHDFHIARWILDERGKKNDFRYFPYIKMPRRGRVMIELCKR